MKRLVRRKDLTLGGATRREIDVRVGRRNRIRPRKSTEIRRMAANASRRCRGCITAPRCSWDRHEHPSFVYCLPLPYERIYVYIYLVMLLA